MNDLAVVICGPSGSGKSTYAAQLALDPRFKIMSPDDLRYELTGDVSDQSRNAFIFNTLLPIRINGVHSSMRDIIIDATNVSRKSRRLIIGYLKTAGYKRIECHVIKVGVDECKRRNAGRARKVPESVIERQHAQWQDPEVSEGFDEVREIVLDTAPQVGEATTT